MYHVSKYQEFQNFKPGDVLPSKYNSKSKEILKLLLNTRIILSSNEIQLSQKQQFVNYFVKNFLEATESEFLPFTYSLNIYGKYIIKLLIFLRANEYNLSFLIIYLFYSCFLLALMQNNADSSFNMFQNFSYMFQLDEKRKSISH